MKDYSLVVFLVNKCRYIFPGHLSAETECRNHFSLMMNFFQTCLIFMVLRHSGPSRDKSVVLHSTRLRLRVDSDGRNRIREVRRRV